MEWNERSRKQELGMRTLTKNARAELLDYQQRKDKLVVGLWETSQNNEATTCHSREKYLLRARKDRRLIPPR